MNNVKLGNSTEKKISSILRSKGFWVLVVAKSATGSQPIDIVAIRGGKKIAVALIDGKHVRGQETSFTFERIEPNQIVSLQYARDYAGINENGMGFGIEFDRTGKIYWLPFSKYLELSEKGQKSVNLNELELFENSEMLEGNENV